VTSSFLTWVQEIGITAIYFIYAGVGVLAFGFSYFVIWETKGKSLEELERDLEHRM